MTSSLENDYAETLSLAKNIFDNMVIEKGEYALQYNTILALTSMIFEEHFKARSSKNAMQLLKLECFPGEVSEMSHLDAACALYVPSFLGSICLVVDNERVEFTISKSKNDSSGRKYIM